MQLNVLMRGACVSIVSLSVFFACIAQRVAVVVPMRDRERHLKILLARYVEFADRHNQSIDLIVIEQDNVGRYNLGKSRNIGFMEARKLRPSHIIFTDVDIWPKADSVWQAMMVPPLSGYYKHFYYVRGTIGGAFSFLENDYYKANGFPNDLVGWGEEDCIFYQRVRRTKLKGWFLDERERNDGFDVDGTHERDKNPDNLGKSRLWFKNRTGISNLSYFVTKRTKICINDRFIYHHIWFDDQPRIQDEHGYV